MLSEQHIVACTSTIALGCKIPHEPDALKWKAIGRRREEEDIPTLVLIQCNHLFRTKKEEYNNYSATANSKQKIPRYKNQI
jgi:hypothetical protein